MIRKEKFVKPWQEFAYRWEYFTPPGRPSKQAIEIYRHLSKEAARGLKRKPRGLILGATPELRDLLAELKFEVTIIDINLEMILAMSELAKKKNPDEIIVKSNWLSNPLASNYYDIVLGDLVLMNIPIKKQKQFLKEIKRVLIPRGCWITRLGLVLNDRQKESFDTVLNKYAEIPFHRFRAMELFCYLLNIGWDPKTGITKASKIRGWMEKYKIRNKRYKHPSQKITRYLDDIWKMWQPMEKQWTFRKEKDTVKQILLYFEIVKKVVLNDYYYHKADQFYPIWVCQVKK